MNIPARTSAGATKVFTSTGELDAALRGSTAWPQRANGADFDVVYLQPPLDGFLLDGFPINVWIDEHWAPGQKEALTALWNSGAVPRPDPAMLARFEQLPESSWMDYVPYMIGGYLAFKLLF